MKEFDRLQQLWDEGLQTAALNYNAEQTTGTKNTAREGGSEQFMSFEDSSNGLANDKLAPYNEEMASLIESRGDVIVDSAKTLMREVDIAIDNRTEKHALYFGNLSADILDGITDDIPNLPKKLNGAIFKNGRDYSLIATLDSIRHLNEQGKLSREDVYRYMERYADTVLNYDDVHYSEYTDSYGNKINGLRFRKNYSDGIQVAYDIVSSKKRALALQTDFSKKNKKSASTLLLHNTGATTPSNGVTTPEARGSQTSNNTITDSSSESKPKTADLTKDQPQRAEEIGNLKARQNEIIQENHPKQSWDNQAWIESVDDIKTFDEAVAGWDGDVTPDYTQDMIKEAKRTGSITVYSSNNIRAGTFVTPSKMLAQDYAGSKDVKSMKVKLADVAWIDEEQGQYAPISQTQDQYQTAEEIDREYLDAVESGDMDHARAMFNRYTLRMADKGITPFVYVGKYRSGHHSQVARDVKTEQADSIEQAAREMAAKLPERAYVALVPMPSHGGRATDMLTLANKISEISGAPVYDVLRGAERESMYKAKKEGRPLSVEDMGMYVEGSIPKGFTPVIIDNVVASGTSGAAAVRALGGGVVFGYAYGSQTTPIRGLKSAEPVTYDNEGNPIPLSQRFDINNPSVQYQVAEIIGDSGTDHGKGVVLDSTLLDNLTETERIQMVKLYVESIGGQSFTAYDSNGDPVDVKVAEKREKFRNRHGKRIAVNKDLLNKYNKDQVKQESIVLIDELLNAASENPQTAAMHPHDWLDNNGLTPWDNWTVIVQDKSRAVWKATLQIANADTGEKILYDIHPIKKVEGPRSLGTSTTGNSKSQSAGSVNTQFEAISPVSDAYQLADKNDTDTEFEAKVRAERMNDLLAENAVLKESVEQLRKEAKKLGKELKLSKGPQETRLSDARKLAGEILKETGSSEDANDVAKWIKEIEAWYNFRKQYFEIFKSSKQRKSRSFKVYGMSLFVTKECSKLLRNN